MSSFEKNRPNRESDKEKIPKGYWVKALIAITDGVLETYRVNREKGDDVTLNKMLDAASKTQEALNRFDPDGKMSGAIEKVAKDVFNDVTGNTKQSSQK